MWSTYSCQFLLVFHKVLCLVHYYSLPTWVIYVLWPAYLPTRACVLHLQMIVWFTMWDALLLSSPQTAASISMQLLTCSPGQTRGRPHSIQQVSSHRNQSVFSTSLFSFPVTSQYFCSSSFFHQASRHYRLLISKMVATHWVTYPQGRMENCPFEKLLFWTRMPPYVNFMSLHVPSLSTAWIR